MATIINVTSLLDPANNGLAPKNLANDIDNFASASLLLQSYALVLASQPTLLAPADSGGLVATTVAAQIALRNHANVVLNTLISRALKQISDATMAGNLFAALSTALPKLPQGNTQSLISLLQAIVVQYQNCADDATGLATLAEREAGKLATAEGNLTDLLSKVSTAIDGPDGSITRLQAAITQKKAEIANTIEAIVRSGQDFGANLKQLATGIVASFVPAEAEAAEPAAATNPNGASNGAAASSPAKAAPRTNGVAAGLRTITGGDDAQPFSVQGIGAVSNDVSANRDAVEQLINGNRELANLYQQLARLNGLLTAATAVRDQCTDYHNAFQRFVLYADQLEKTWSLIVAGAQQTVSDLQQNPSDDFDHQTQAMISVANRYWQRVLDRSQQLGQSFANGSLSSNSSSAPLSAARVMSF
jgi:hypothetical protein